MAKTYDPFEEIKKLEREIDEIFSSFWRGTRPMLAHPRHGGEIEPATYSLSFVPSADVIEKDAEIIVKTDLPGVDKKDVKIKIEVDKVTISGELKKEHKEKEENYFIEERVYGNFYRTIPLPAEIDPEKAQAKFENGVLEITLPKVEVGKKAKEITLG
ncbi:MAG: Hsp20/alpha crystallin family protein [Caldisericaceae bacterium]